ncbi:MAG: hypothetical protein PUC11_04065 [Elusimicrobia bacterium]|nr:hypothetical protein [Elusimicrobiota bacterium]
MKQQNHMSQQQYKEALEALCGREVSEQEAFDALIEQVELIRILDEIERALPAYDVHCVPNKECSQGGTK